MRTCRCGSKHFFWSNDKRAWICVYCLKEDYEEEEE